MGIQLEKLRTSIGFKLVFYILILSLAATIIFTTIRSYYAYQNHIQTIHEHMGYIKKSYLPSITGSLWAMDKERIQTHLDGLLRLPYMQYAVIKLPDNKVFVSAGSPDFPNKIIQSIPISYKYNNKDVAIGVFEVHAAFQPLRSLIWEEIYSSLPEEGLKMLILAFCFLFIIHFLLTKHLFAMAAYARQLNIHDKIIPLSLHRRFFATKQDELDEVVFAINDVLNNLKQSFEDLSRSNAILNAAGHMARIGGWEVDAETKEVRWTEETYRIHDIPLDYKPPIDEAINYFHPDDRERLKEGIRRALEYGEPYDMEIRFISAKGNYLWTRTICYPQVVDGKTVKLLGAFQDITSSKQMEEKLKESEEYFRSLIENSSDIISVYNADNVMLYQSPSVERLVGYKPEEVIGKKRGSVVVIHKDDIFAAINTAEKAIRNPGIPFGPVIQRIQHKDGSWRWFEAIYKATVQKSGEVIVIINSRDVSERKQAEERLKLTQFAVDHAKNDMLLVAPDGRFVDVNDSACASLGYTRDELLTMTILDINPHVSRESIESDWNLLKEKIFLTFETSHKRKDGSLFPVEVTLNLLSFEGKEWFFGVVQDITSRKQAENALKSSLHEKEILLKEIHHRVKNNLQVISSLLNLQSGYLTDAKTLGIFKASMDRIKSMALVHNKLYHSPNLARLDLKGYVNDLAVTLLHTYSTDKEIAFDNRIKSIPLTIDTAVPLGLLINELISNSLKHAFPNNGDCRITINCKKERDDFILTISDNGIGFPKDIDFTNTKSLGMQLVVTLVEQLDGTIELNRDHGAEFKIKFSEAE